MWLLVVAAGSHALRHGAAQAPAQAANPESGTNFFRDVARALSCEALEVEVVQQCATLPFYQALLQFQGSLSNCQAVLRLLPDVQILVDQTLGPGSGCTSLVSKWRYHYAPTGEALYADGEACSQAVRTQEYQQLCAVPVLPTA